MIKWLIRAGATAGALSALGVLWISLGFPTLATGSDIKRLDRTQAEHAVELYNAKLRTLLVIAPPANTPAAKAWEEELRQAREQVKRAEDRKIELGK
jgi:hypothetical protein